MQDIWREFVIKLKDILVEKKVCDTAGIMLVNTTAGIVLCKDSEKWGIPKGKVEPGETPLEAACREVLEEVSILISPGDLYPMSVGCSVVELACTVVVANCVAAFPCI